MAGGRKHNSVKASVKEVSDYVEVEKLPKFAELKVQVDELVSRSSWWDMHGVDWAIIVVALMLIPIGLSLLRSDLAIVQVIAMCILGYSHAICSSKSTHISTHGSLTPAKILTRPVARFFNEFLSGVSEELVYEGHVKEHHAYTNIIGLGDSAVWKAPFLPRYVYMFLAPLSLPLIAPLFSIAGLIQKGRLFGMIKFVIVFGLGLSLMVYLLMKVSHFTFPGALMCLCLWRNLLTIPYIHVNIFQHIGLPMYSMKNRPVRLYQMSTGALNLPRNVILDYAFGHSLISCHVEHHLFPRLSDNMCLKIKPVVSKFLKENGLPYNQDTYKNRLRYFLDNYEELMVNAPPITHFIGI